MDKKVQFRITTEEKEKLDKLASLTGAKNNSDFIRKYINDLYDFIYPVTKGIYDFDDIIKKLQDDKEKSKEPWSSYVIQNKITILEELKKTYLSKQP